MQIKGKLLESISRHKKELLEEHRKTKKLLGSPADINTLV